MNFRALMLLFFCVAASTAVAAAEEAYDVIIRHGRIVDGSGNPAFFSDLGIRKGHIATIGRIVESAAKEIDATGLIVAPGFIDVHTHADEIAEMPRAENFARMGVTTVVVGNCGGSTLNVDNFFLAIEKNNAAINVGTVLGPNTPRPGTDGRPLKREP